jgi:arylsulfatase A-like enzyme
MSGGKRAWWKDEDMADVLSRRATTFIDQNKDRPFFLYFATHDIHVPRVPHPRFSGTSQCGVRGDVLQQLDGSVGDILTTLDRLKLSGKTLVLFSSDNGPVVDDGYQDGSVEALDDHRPAGPYRGGKYSIYEGGTRVPLIARWPGRIPHGVSDALVSQVDFMASFSALAGKPLPNDVGPDSWNVLSALLGGASEKGREHLVEQAQGLALRKGAWKLVPPSADAPPKELEPGDKPPKPAKPSGVQLYNLLEDPGERKNVADSHPDLVETLSAELARLEKLGRSRP